MKPSHFDPCYHPAGEREVLGVPSSAMRREMLKEKIRAEIIARNSEEWSVPEENVMYEMEMEKAMRREMMKERIRAEIIARNSEELRVLEEEVMREMEMEMESAMGVQRVVPPLPPSPGFSDKRRVESGEGHDSGVLVNPPVKRARKEQSLGHDGRGFEMMEPSPAAAPVAVAAAVAEAASLFGKKMKEPAVRLGKETWRCDLCNVTTTSEDDLNDHKNGKRHKAMLRNKVESPGGQSWNCAVCQVSMTCQDNLNDHLKGKKHRSMVKMHALWTSNNRATSSMPMKEE